MHLSGPLLGLPLRLMSSTCPGFFRCFKITLHKVLSYAKFTENFEEPGGLSLRNTLKDGEKDWLLGSQLHEMRGGMRLLHSTVNLIFSKATGLL